MKWGLSSKLEALVVGRSIGIEQYFVWHCNSSWPYLVSNTAHSQALTRTHLRHGRDTKECYVFPQDNVLLLNRSDNHCFEKGRTPILDTRYWHSITQLTALALRKAVIINFIEEIPCCCPGYNKARLGSTINQDTAPLNSRAVFERALLLLKSPERLTQV